MATAERERSQSVLGAVLSIVLLAAIAGMVNYVGTWYFRRSDWTGAKLYSVSDKTKQILASLDKDVKVTVFMMTENQVYPFVNELLQQFRRYAPRRISVETIDIDKQRENAALLAKKYKIGGEELRDGVVVFEAGQKTKYVTKSELVEYDYRESPTGAEDPKMRSFKGEGAFDSALLTVTEGQQAQICFIKGHGERDAENFDEPGYSSFAEELKRDNYQVQSFGSLGKSPPPSGCAVFVVAGPERAWDRAEADALGALIDGGAKVMVFAGPVLDRDLTRFLKTGLEQTLARFGVQLGDNIVVDPAGAHPLEGPTVWATDAYTSHAIVKSLAGKVTFWPQAREVRASPAGGNGVDAQELVRTTDKGWGETSLAVFRQQEPLRFDAATDAKGPVPVAVAAEVRGKGGRLVVVGTSMLVENYRLKGDVLRDYNLDFALSAMAWLAKKEQLVAVGPKQPEHIKLMLTDGQLRSAAWLTIVGMPLFGLMLGGCVWWRRRA